jgi:tRNA threonylcarbamoyladenosine biosynthesis protein TsaE
LPHDSFQFEAQDEAGTAAFGHALARALPARCVVALNGTLGAGKTRLVQAVAEACGIERRDVISPTFVLVQEYHGRRSIYHVDAYRLRDEDEFLALGVDERFDEDVLVFIEWAERVAGCLPRERIEIRIAVIGDQERRFDVRALTAAHHSVIQSLQDELA